MTERRSLATAYDILGVHPAAPSDLIGACYWMVTAHLQGLRGTGGQVDQLLHHVTRAYESVADPVRRAQYDLSLGLTPTPLSQQNIPGRRSLRSRIFRRKGSLPGRDIDPYEVLGLQVTALPAAIPEGHRIMREQFLRLPADSQRRAVLMRLLEESFEILSDPDRRATVDKKLLAKMESQRETETTPPQRAMSKLPELDPAAPSAPIEAPTTAQPGPAPGPKVVPITASAEAFEEPASTEALPAGPSFGKRAGAVVAGAARASVLAVAAVARWTATGVAWIARTAWNRISRGWLAFASRRRSSPPGQTLPPRTAKPGKSRASAIDPDEVFLERLAATVMQAESHMQTKPARKRRASAGR